MTQSNENFSILRRLLRAIGLSPEAVDEIVEWILDFLAEPRVREGKLEYPYSVSRDFLTPAELSFFHVLQSVVMDRATICPKVALGDLFSVKSEDPSMFRTCRNRIDRKPIDFLLCHP